MTSEMMDWESWRPNSRLVQEVFLGTSPKSLTRICQRYRKKFFLDLSTTKADWDSYFVSFANFACVQQLLAGSAFEKWWDLFLGRAV